MIHLIYHIAQCRDTLEEYTENPGSWSLDIHGRPCRFWEDLGVSLSEAWIDEVFAGVASHHLNGPCM